MAKRKTAGTKKKPRAPKKDTTFSSERGRVIPSNGSVEQPIMVAPEPDHKVTIGEAMRLAVEQLGDLKIDNDLAPAQMRELGEIVVDIARRRAAHDAKAEEAKTAKKSLESAQELLVEKVRSFTHPAPMPLFDHEQAEDDRAEMITGGVEELGLSSESTEAIQ